MRQLTAAALAAALVAACLSAVPVPAQEPAPPEDIDDSYEDCLADGGSEETCGGRSTEPEVTTAAAPAPKIGPTPQALTVTVNLTGTPLTGTCPYNINLSWTATNASVCTKTGAWSGNAAASGSEQLSVNGGTQTYTLTCSSATDTRTVTWVNPTTNTDGTAVSLTGNKVFHAASAANIETAHAPITLVPAKTTYLLAGLPSGPRVIGVKATGQNGVDSAMSALASTTITLPTGVDTVNATCTPPAQPKPPTAVTVASTVWDVRRSMGESPVAVGRDVGVIELGAPCIGEKPILTQGTPETGTVAEYWDVPRTNPPTRLYRKPRSTMLLGQCEVTAEWQAYRDWLATPSG